MAAGGHIVLGFSKLLTPRRMGVIRSYHHVKFEVCSFNGSGVMAENAKSKMAAGGHIDSIFRHFSHIVTCTSTSATTVLNLKSVAQTVLKL
jgi:hypothetical protein